MSGLGPDLVTCPACQRAVSKSRWYGHTCNGSASTIDLNFSAISMGRTKQCPVCLVTFKPTTVHQCTVAKGMTLSYPEAETLSWAARQRTQSRARRQRIIRQRQEQERRGARAGAQAQRLAELDQRAAEQKERRPGKRRRGRFTDEQRVEAVRYSHEHTVREAAEKWEVSEWSIQDWRRWVRQGIIIDTGSPIEKKVSPFDRKVSEAQTQLDKLVSNERARQQLDRLFAEADLTAADADALRARTVTLTHCAKCGTSRRVYRDKHLAWRHLDTGKIECGHNIGTAQPADNRRSTVRRVRMMSP